jgi:hypothetical protein
MSLSKSGNKNHDTTVAVAESSLQNAVATATTQGQINSATISFYKSAITSGLANGVDVGSYIFAVRSLGGTV